MIKLKSIGLLCLFLVVGIFSCSDPVVDDNEQVKEISFYLTDCPFDADEVNVEILLVSVKNEDGSVIDLNTNSGIYNLLDFQDGVDTLIATGNVDFDDIKHVYFELGTENTIVIDGVSHPLELRNPNSNVIKVKLDLDQVQNGDNYVIEFFACTSIIETPNGYYLKPVIKFKGKKEHHDPHNDYLEDLLEEIKKCYDIEYPINFVNESGDNFEANSDEDVIDILTHNDDLELVYPINVTSQDGNTIMLENKEDIKNLEDCHEDDHENEHFEEAMEAILACYEFVFPVTFIDVNDMEVIATNLDEVLALLGDSSLVDFVYPFNLLKEGGEELHIPNPEKLKHLEDDCEDDENEHFEEGMEAILECYEFVFPVYFIDENDMEWVANDLEEVEALLENSSLVDFVYPFTILKEGGHELVILDSEMLKHLNDDCEDDPHDEEFGEAVEAILRCYEFAFPVTFLDSSEMEVVAHNLDELLTLYENSTIVAFVFPFDIIKENGNSLTIQNENMLHGILQSCEEHDLNEELKGIFEELEDCLEIVYPIKFNGSNGNLYTAHNKEELDQILEIKPLDSVVFPIYLLDANQHEIEVTTLAQLEELSEGC